MAGGGPLFVGHDPAAAFSAAAGLAVMTARRGGFSLLVIALLAPAATASAQSGSQAPAPSGGEAGIAPVFVSPAGRIGGPTPCVQVEIAGYRAGQLDCASQRLQDAARMAQARAPNADSFDIPGATAADVVTGVANQTATRQRMGDRYGVGVKPQRPKPSVYAPPVGRRP